MSDVRLVIREADRDWSGTIHGSVADRAIAALSADPMTLAELETACARYQKPNPDRPILANLSEGLCDEPFDAGIVVIDLVVRLVLTDSTYSSPESTGDVCYHDGSCATDKWLRYHLAEDWLFIRDHSQWPSAAKERRRERAARPPLDVRAVFYGRPLLEFVARETLATYSRIGVQDSPPRDAIKDIHAAWLLTPREDLGGHCPRDLAVASCHHLTWDLQDQAERWSLLGHCPPGLEESTFAFRYGGFGTHELVKYYDLVRELLWNCWDRLVELGKVQPDGMGPESPVVGDFLASEVPRLERFRDAWMDAPDPGCHGRTPRSVIDRERARLPEGMSGHDAMADPDCPCCQMLADMPGPAFWHLDGSNMEDEFAFDMRHPTREEWEAEQRKWDEHNKRFNAEWEERKRLGVTGTGFGEPGENAVWSSSYSAGDGEGVPLSVRLFTIGVRLAELITDIRGELAAAPGGPDAQQWIGQLNRDFGNMREVLQNSDPTLADALYRPVIDRFTDSLAGVASSRTDLAAKCESLTNSLSRFLDPQWSESAWDVGDSESPF
jgi:hypothetical protein